MNLIFEKVMSIGLLASAPFIFVLIIVLFIKRYEDE